MLSTRARALCFVYKAPKQIILQKLQTHRFSAGAGGKHLSDAGGSTHDPGAVAQHEDQLLNISWAKRPILARRQGHQLHSFHHLGYRTKNVTSLSLEPILCCTWPVPWGILLPSSSTTNSKPFFRKMSMFSMRMLSLMAVRWSFWGLQTHKEVQ